MSDGVHPEQIGPSIGFNPSLLANSFQVVTARVTMHSENPDRRVQPSPRSRPVTCPLDLQPQQTTTPSNLAFSLDESSDMCPHRCLFSKHQLSTRRPHRTQRLKRHPNIENQGAPESLFQTLRELQFLQKSKDLTSHPKNRIQPT